MHSKMLLRKSCILLCRMLVKSYLAKFWLTCWSNIDEILIKSWSIILMSNLLQKVHDQVTMFLVRLDQVFLVNWSRFSARQIDTWTGDRRQILKMVYNNNYSLLLILKQFQNMSKNKKCNKINVNSNRFIKPLAVSKGPIMASSWKTLENAHTQFYYWN